eukprot:CAMPEP_0116576766 /NCGR_PEP_ID=MMETSP0397-20121206/20724_1 /TAXON_ID=216820 /ORGANISM="Cyclophora tenuis, Strain ECT3854" /LENGTH=148 /DNA_ID=CAMNT_0004105863 /DNA_START=164 /DNA_END=610 /DNA_ORIENTATION=+
MNDPMMDPLEWTVRKVIPIPKAYFWETGNTDLPPRTKLWHRTVGAMSNVVKFVDTLGKPVGEFTGVTSSRYDYVTSTMTQKQMETARQTANLRKESSKAGRSTRALQCLDEDEDVRQIEADTEDLDHTTLQIEPDSEDHEQSSLPEFT